MRIEYNMHEMSYVVRMVNLAQKTVENELAKDARPFRVKKIVVSVGEMTGVIPMYLHRYYPEAVKGTLLEGSELETEDLPAMVRCLDCETEYHPSVENEYSCPNCRGIQGKVTQGRDVLLKEVVVEEGE